MAATPSSTEFMREMNDYRGITNTPISQIYHMHMRESLLHRTCAGNVRTHDFTDILANRAALIEHYGIKFRAYCDVDTFDRFIVESTDGLVGVIDGLYISNGMARHIFTNDDIYGHIEDSRLHVLTIYFAYIGDVQYLRNNQDFIFHNINDTRMVANILHSIQALHHPSPIYIKPTENFRPYPISNAQTGVYLSTKIRTRT